MRSRWGLLIGGLLVVAAYVGVLYYFFVTPLSFRWKAMFGEAEYPAGYSVMGIDISHHQAQIDWDKLRNARIGNLPIRFVIIKATEGLSLSDENFNDNFFWAQQNQMVRGAYHFYIPDKDVKRQAQFYLRQVHLVDGDLPPILDLEKRGREPLKAFQEDVITWLETVKKVYGVNPIIYTGKSFKETYLNSPAFDEYPLWIAHYYEKALKYEGDWAMWQFTDCGRVDGINGYVDFDIFNGDMNALMDLTIKSNSEEPFEE